MANGITIMSREWIIDSAEPGGKKQLIVYGVESSALIGNLLTLYPDTGNGSLAICLPEGVCKQLFNGVWK